MIEVDGRMAVAAVGIVQEGRSGGAVGIALSLTTWNRNYKH